MEIEISRLPIDLSSDQAVEVAYRVELDWIEDKLLHGLSVLVECDKQLTNHLYRAIRERIKKSGIPKKLRLISGHAQGGEEIGPQTRMQRIIHELQEAIFSATDDLILTLPHLDILTTTTRSGLNNETREAAALLFENPDAVFFGFKDPSFELPKVIENVFTVKRSIVGISRERLPHIILQREARKLGVERFNPYRLYTYLSGLNALRCREVLAHITNRIDFDPKTPQTLRDLYAEIRQMTLIADVELPSVELEKDIGGYHEVKSQIKREIIDLLNSRETMEDPDEIKQIEELIPKGLIFHGPPGTGKTFFCKAIATALNATIIIVSGPELKSKWVGESEENLRRVFAQARKAAPSIIVFDELDSFASARGTYTGSGVEHSMVNQLLTEMDGFRKEELVFVVGTTNFMDSLDPALLRPGRFELNIHIPYPHSGDRREILTLYRERFSLPLSDNQIENLVRQTGGVVEVGKPARYSGDHLYAVMRALKREQLRGGVGFEMTEEVLSNVINSRKVKPARLTIDERRVISIHEAGHAVCAYHLPHCARIKEVSIASDSAEFLGYLAQVTKENPYVTTREELQDDICVLLGGRLAEEVLLGSASTGAYNDLQRATEIARMMVEEFGMSELGLRSFSGGAAQTRIGVSEKLSQTLDEAITHIIQAQRERALDLIQTHRTSIESLSEYLIERGRCDAEMLEQLFG